MGNKRIEDMSMIEIARDLAEMGIVEDAVAAYTTALKQGNLAPDEKMEAACAVFQFGNDYKIAYRAFLELYEEGSIRQDTLGILQEAFYAPNVKLQKKRYEKNCKLLKKYPYLFRKDFPKFEELPVKFFPFDDNGVLPFYPAEERFDEYIDFNEPEIRHYFFKDLSKPIFARDIYSQYELEYLRDNVRRSDWAAKENHIYLHYSDWGVFCAHLQCLDMKPILEEEKIVFLIEEEESLYPMDFKERFGIDYSAFPRRPFSVREVNKLIWHTQLGYHNGGDFFNEIMDGHPYLLGDTSRYLKDHTEMMYSILENVTKTARVGVDPNFVVDESVYNRDVFRELFSMKDATIKDAFVGFYLTNANRYAALDPESRIAPAIIFQPHFSNMKMEWLPNEEGGATVCIGGCEDVKESVLFKDFKYIKTFTPMRRPTTSMAATNRFIWGSQLKPLKQYNAAKISGEIETLPEDVKNCKKTLVSGDLLSDFIMNRSFMVSGADRMFRDSRLVRFEDGKTNPTATFTALAEFLDIPYTESMKSCTGENMLFRDGKPVGFDLGPVQRTYDQFADENERILLEFCLRDAYKAYGYDFKYFDGEDLTSERMSELLGQANTILDITEQGIRESRDGIGEKDGKSGTELDEWIETLIRENIGSYREKRELAARLSAYQLLFHDPQGNRLQLMKKLELDPALLENEIYH